MYRIGGEEPIAANAADFQDAVNEGPSDRVTTIGRLSLSFAPAMTRTAELEAAGRADTVERAIEEGKLVDWMPNIDNNETPTPVVAGHIGV